MAKTNKKDVHRGVVLYLDGKEVATNAASIRAEMKKVRKQIDQMTVGSEEYIAATKRYRQLDGILQQHRMQLKHVETQQQSMVQKGVSLFKKYALGISSAVAAFAGIVYKLNQFRKEAMDTEDAAANLKALTGLDDTNIAWLQQQAETLSTTMEASGLRVRKSVKEILEAYMLVGSAKPELLTDKEALNAVTIEAMRLAEAAKMDLNAAVNALTSSLNQFGASADDAARYTNVLAAGSKFGAANVTEQASAILKAGVAASGANLSIEQLVGTIEVLGEKGIKSEVAGTGLKKFFLTLQTGAKETNPAVVGLDQALENLVKKNMSAAQIKKMFGEEGFNIAKILMDNASKVKEYTQLVTGTNTAVEQAAINSSTMSAKMAQLRNEISLTGQALTKDLSPVYESAIGLTRQLIAAIPVIISFFKNHATEILQVAAAYAAYNVAINISNIRLKAHNALVMITTALTKGYRIVVDTLKAAYIGLQVVQARLTRNWPRQNALMLDLKKNAAALTNVYALMAAAVAAVVVGLIAYVRKMDIAGQTQKMLNKLKSEAVKKMGEERVSIDLLIAAANNERLSMEKRKEAVEKLNKIIPNYNAQIDATTGKYKASKAALDDYLQSLTRQYELEGAREKLAELGREKAEARMRVQQAEESVRRAKNAPGQNYTTSFGAVGNTGEDVRRIAQQHLDAARKAEELVDAKIKTLTDAYGAQMQEAEVKKAQATEELIDPEPKKTITPETESEKEKRIREAIASVNAQYDAMAAEAKRAYLAGEIATEQAYSQQLQDIEMKRLQAQMQIAGLEADKREALQNKILDIKVKLLQQLEAFDDLELSSEEKKLQKMLQQNEDAYARRNSIIESALQAGVISEEQAAIRRKQNEEKRRADDLKAEEDAAAKRLAISRSGLESSLLQLRKVRAEEGMTEQEYNNAILMAQQAFYERALQDQSLSQEDREDLERQLAATKLEIVERSNEAITTKNKQLFDALQSIGEDLSNAIGDLFSDTESDLKDFSKAILKTIVKTVENIMTAAIVQRTVENIRTLGFWGVAKAAGEIALIKAAGAALSGLVDNFYTGGYTGPGKWDEPRGVVHAGEFVANRYAVANSAVRPVLDLIDAAQKNGSIANLSADDITAVARPSSTATAAAAGTDPQLAATLRRLSSLTEMAAEAYKEPSLSVCYLEGQGGINQAQELLRKIKKNASRT